MSFNLDLKKVFVQLAGISYNSAEINGPGLRQVYFAQGCPHHCKGCFNPET
jgi:anaerobic ribonucleoside-triphosphate reductase activating protein